MANSSVGMRAGVWALYRASLSLSIKLAVWRNHPTRALSVNLSLCGESVSGGNVAASIEAKKRRGGVSVAHHGGAQTAKKVAASWRAANENVWRQWKISVNRESSGVASA